MLVRAAIRYILGNAADTHPLAFAALQLAGAFFVADLDLIAHMTPLRRISDIFAQAI